MSFKEDIIKELQNWLSARGQRNIGIYDKVFPLVVCSIGRVLNKTASRGENWIEYLNTNKNNVDHILDWIEASVINNEVWLSKTDALNRPKKLMKFSNIQDIASEADKAMKISNQKLATVINNSNSDCEIVHSFADGYYIGKLLTVEALDHESAVMQHCVGQGSYDSIIGRDDSAIYSLRDAFGKSHATIYISNNYIVELQGKQNKQPIEKYRHLIRDWVMLSNFNNPEHINVLEIIKDDKDNWYRLDELPDGFRYDGHLILNSKMIKKLPDEMTINGDLELKNLDITQLPNNMIINGFFVIDQTPVVSLPADINVYKDIQLRNIDNTINLPVFQKNISSLYVESIKGINIPDNFSVEVLDIGDIEEITWGKNTEIYKASIKRTNLSKIPENIISNSFFISSEIITSIPEDLSRIQNFSFSSLKEVQMQDNFKIGGIFNIHNTTIKKLPSHITATAGSFYDCQIIETSDILRVDGGLSITNLRGNSLPDEIICKDYIYFNDIYEKLPKQIKANMICFSRSNDFSQVESLLSNEKILFEDSNCSILPINIRVPGLIIYNSDYIDMSNHLDSDFTISTIDKTGISVREYEIDRLYSMAERYGLSEEDIAEELALLQGGDNSIALKSTI